MELPFLYMVKEGFPYSEIWIDLEPFFCAVVGAALEKAKNREIINNLNNKHNSGGLLATSTSTSGIPAKKVTTHRACFAHRRGSLEERTSALSLRCFVQQEPSKSQSQSTEAPGSWRTSLRKAGSSVTLGSAGGSDPSQDPPRPLDSGLGMTRSASSPRLSSEAEPKVKPRPQRGTRAVECPNHGDMIRECVGRRNRGVGGEIIHKAGRQRLHLKSNQALSG